MAKRFIKTDVLRNPWIRKAKPVHKVLWIAILTECDHAGVWIVDFDMMGILCGGEVTESEAREFLRGRFIEIDDGRRWFFPDFIRFQYPAGIFGNNNNLKSIRAILEKYGVCLENLTLLNPRPTLDQPLAKTRPTLDQGLQEKEEEEYSIVEEYSNTYGTLSGNGEKNLGGSKNSNLNGVDVAKEVADFITTYGVGQKRHQTEQAYIATLKHLTNPSGGMGYTAPIACAMLKEKAASYRTFCIAVSQTPKHPPNWLNEHGYMTDWNQELVNYRQLQKGKNENGHGKQKSAAAEYGDRARQFRDQIENGGFDS